MMIKALAVKGMAVKGMAALAMTTMGILDMAAPASASSAPPLRARFVATEERAPDLACGGLRILAEGSGWATQLGGQVQLELDECANFVVEPGRVHVDGTAVLTAANGDRLEMAYALVGDAPHPVTGEVRVAGPFTISDGTGRLAAASGSGDLLAETSIHSDVVTITLDGTMVTAPRERP